MTVALAAFSLALVLCALTVGAWVLWTGRKPITSDERLCGRVDQELDAERDARMPSRRTGGGWML